MTLELIALIIFLLFAAIAMWYMRRYSKKISREISLGLAERQKRMVTLGIGGRVAVDSQVTGMGEAEIDKDTFSDSTDMDSSGRK